MTLRILVAPDSFKGSLSSPQVCQAMETGIRAVVPDATVHCFPMADGGEGTMEAVVSAWQGRRCAVTVTGPMGLPTPAAFGLSGDGMTAVLDMASASGLTLVAPAEQRPLLASSFGTGELLAAALDSGAEHIIMGIGGSATNDGGAGMLQALGYRLLDREGRDIPRGAFGLTQLTRIETHEVHPRLKAVTLAVACDVVNPLLGMNGASFVFGPQKGAGTEVIPVLEAALAHFASVVEQHLGKVFRHEPGAGAAGGLGFSLLSLLNARLQSGFDLVASITGFDTAVRTGSYRWLLTGEGQVDTQSQQGKLLSRIGRLALETNTPVIAFVGAIVGDAHALALPGVDHIFPIVPGPCSLGVAMEQAGAFLTAAVTRVMKLAGLA